MVQSTIIFHVSSKTLYITEDIFLSCRIKVFIQDKNLDHHTSQYILTKVFVHYKSSFATIQNQINQLF